MKENIEKPDLRLITKIKELLGTAVEEKGMLSDWESNPGLPRSLTHKRRDNSTTLTVSPLAGSGFCDEISTPTLARFPFPIFICSPLSGFQMNERRNVCMNRWISSVLTT
jgi:hypothetical protein